MAFLGVATDAPTFSTIKLTGFQFESSTDNVAASGSGQSSATVLNTEINRITSGTGGVILPPSQAGMDIFVINHSGASLSVYAAGSDTIDDVSGATGIAQMAGSLTLYSCASPGNWYSNGIGTGYAGSLPTVSYSNAITAKAGGGQSGATALTTALNRVTVVATANDSVVLPTAAPGLQITVINAAANSLNVFPASGDQINALGANAAFAVAGSKTTTFFSTVTGQWHALLSA